MTGLKPSTRPRSLQQTRDDKVQVRAQLTIRSKKKVPVSLAGSRPDRSDQED